MSPNPVAVHQLKCWVSNFQATVEGMKTHEFRKDDRGYRIGDELFLSEFDPDTETLTGRNFRVRVTWITRSFGVPEGYCVMSVKPIVES